MPKQVRHDKVQLRSSFCQAEFISASLNNTSLKAQAAILPKQ
jgi:hypothetical protein